MIYLKELKMKKYLPLIIFIFFFLSCPTVFGQIQETDITLSLTPKYPAPNQNVSATLVSQAIDLDKVLISWSLNGETLLGGIGKKDFQFNVGSLGTTVNLSVSIDTTEGTSLQKNISIRPTETDMLWEAPETYVPPFYKGKALPSSQSKIKVVALPSFVSSGEKIKEGNLSYIWKKDGKSQLAYSGWGKNQFIFRPSYLDPKTEIFVQVSDILGNLNSSGWIVLKTGNPKIVFYRRDPSFGTDWSQALTDGYSINPKGETVVAEPYFFSETEIDSPNLSFSWFLNGQKIETPNPKNILSMRLEEDGSGTARIKTTIENVKALFQEASKEIMISF